jgi:ribosome maturation factor RimP
MTRNPVNGNRHFEGRLENFKDGKLTLDLRKPSKSNKKSLQQKVTSAPEKLELDLANIEKANLVPEL